MSERIDTDLVLKALAMALLHRSPPAKLLFHTDRGVQYASGDYRQALGEAGLIASMSRRGNCYDNATMESFWATLKLELVYRRRFDTRAQARTQIFDYIETFYNRQRAHSALGYHSPVSKLFRNVPCLTHERMSPSLLVVRGPLCPAGVRDGGRPERSGGRPSPAPQPG